MLFAVVKAALGYLWMCLQINRIILLCKLRLVHFKNINIKYISSKVKYKNNGSKYLENIFKSILKRFATFKDGSFLSKFKIDFLNSARGKLCQQNANVLKMMDTLTLVSKILFNHFLSSNKFYFVCKLLQNFKKFGC